MSTKMIEGLSGLVQPAASGASTGASTGAAATASEEQEILNALNSRALANGKDLTLDVDGNDGFLLTSSSALSNPLGFSVVLNHINEGAMRKTIVAWGAALRIGAFGFAPFARIADEQVVRKAVTATVRRRDLVAYAKSNFQGEFKVNRLVSPGPYLVKVVHMQYHTVIEDVDIKATNRDFEIQLKREE